MAKKKKIDTKNLMKMVQDGNATKEIMKKFGFKTSTQLKVAYLNAAMEAGIVPEIKSGRSTSENESVSKEIIVNKRGSLIVPRKLIEDFGFKEGDIFEAKKTKAGISLKKK
jgi:uncharacterized protein (DUF433 family)